MLTTTVRLFLKGVVPPLRRWDAQIAIEGDRAAPGKNVHAEVSKRMAKAEAEMFRGKTWTQLMLEIQAFYDSMAFRMFSVGGVPDKHLPSKRVHA